MKVIDVTIAPNLHVGYIMGVGDQVPQAIEQLGAQVELIDADTLAFGDLSQLQRDRRPACAPTSGGRICARTTSRLIQYAENGGTVLVQYNKFEFNDAQYGPYPAKVSANRVTDEHAPDRGARAGSSGFNRAEQDRT